MSEEFSIPNSITGYSGLGDPFPMLDKSPSAASTVETPGELIFVRTQNAELQTEIERLRAERDRLAARERVIMDLLGTSSADRILHDLRNVLNERSLYRALADIEGAQR
jgi:Tfp pilus assembly protein PilN